MTITKSDRHSREWELCFRMAEVLCSRLCDSAEIKDRRQNFSLKYQVGCVEGSLNEALRTSSRVHGLCDWLAARWIELFDDFWKDRTAYIFDDGFAVLFSSIPGTVYLIIVNL